MEYLLLTARELAEKIVGNAGDHSWSRYDIECKFAIADEESVEKGYDLESIALNSNGWYGLHDFESGFDSCDLDIAIDYYGGGTLHTVTLCDGMDEEDATREIEEAIIGTMTVREILSHDTKLIVEFEMKLHKDAPISTVIEPLENRDKILEKLWSSLEDVPMDPDTEKIEAEFQHFPAGTDREDIWSWFDARHSKGVAYLLYGNSVERSDETVMLAYYNSLCSECESKDCAFNCCGQCRYPLVEHRVPIITEEDGCKEYCYKASQHLGGVDYW